MAGTRSRRFSCLAIPASFMLCSMARPALAEGGPSIERPMAPACKLVLEDIRKPGTKVDVSAYRGKPVVVRGICPE